MSRPAREGHTVEPRKVKCRVLDGICLSVGDRYPGDLVEVPEDEARPLLARRVLELVHAGAEP